MSKRKKIVIVAVLGVVLGIPLVASLIVYAILSSFDYDSLKTTIEQSVEAATGRELSMSGDIKIDLGLTPRILVENVRFQNASWGTRSDMATLTRFELEVAVLPLLSNTLVVKRLIVVEPDIIIETDGEGASNLDFLNKIKAKDPRKPHAAPMTGDGRHFELTFKQVEIENGRLTYRDGATRKTYTFAMDKLEAGSDGGRSPIRLELEGSYNGSPFEMDGTVGPLTAIGDPDEPWRVSLYAEIAGAVINLDGVVKDVPGAKGIDLNVTAEGGSIADITKFLDISGAPDVGPYRISARVTDPSAGVIRFSKMEATLGDSNLAGSIKIESAPERPRIKATLTSQKLDLRPFISTGDDRPDETAGDTSPADKVFPNDPLPLDALGAIDADVSIRARRVLLPRMALDDVGADIKLHDGTLVAEQVKTRIGGGSLDSRLELKRTGDEAHPSLDLSVELKIKRLDIGLMLDKLDIREKAEGELDADIKLTARGASVAELMAGLNGTTVVTGGGRVKNKYIELLGGGLSSGIFRLVNPLSRDTDYTEINCLVSRFDITDGIAHSAVLVADTDGMTVFGEGEINLKTEGLNMGLKPSPKKGLAAKPGVSLGVSELIKPFRLRGTLAEPKLALDPTLSPIALGKDVLDAFGSGSGGLLSGLLGRQTADADPCATAIAAATGAAPPPAPEKSAPAKVDAPAPGQPLRETTQELNPDESPPATNPIENARSRFKKLLRR